MAELTPWLTQKFYAADGTTPLAGGRVWTYEAGTSTPKISYTTQAGDVANANPVILDANGEPDSGGIWMSGGAYKFVVAAATDLTDPPTSPIRTIDGVNLGDDSNHGVVSTIAELTALAEGEFVSVEVLGYTSAGDGGGGLFYWNGSSTATPNLGTIFTPDTPIGSDGRWLRQYTNKIEARWFGAKGDGVTDDTTSIQAAIDFLNGLTNTDNLRNPKTLLMKNGKYVITSTLTLYVGISIIGDGTYTNAEITGVPNTTINFEPVSAADLFHIYKTAGTFYDEKVNISDIYLKGNTVNGSTNSRYAIDIDSMANCIFERVGIRGFQVGVRTERSITNIYNEVYISGCTTSCINYHTTSSTTDVWSNCMFRGVSGVITTPWAAVIETAISIRFIDCNFENLDEGIMDIRYPSQDIQVLNGHAEQIPESAGATKAQFKIGTDGDTNYIYANTLTVQGGSYFGGGAGKGDFMITDYVTHVNVTDVFLRNFDNGITTNTTNTKDYSIHVAGLAHQQVTTLLNGDVDKYYGDYLLSGQNTATQNSINTGSFFLAQNNSPGSYGGSGAVRADVGGIYSKLQMWGAQGITLEDNITLGAYPATLSAAGNVTLSTTGNMLLGDGVIATRPQGGLSPKMLIEGLATQANSMIGLIHNANDATAPIIALGKSRGTAVGDDTIVQAGDQLGTIIGTGSDGSPEQAGAAWMRMLVSSDTPALDDIPGEIEFGTHLSGGTSISGINTRLKISNDGTIVLNPTTTGTDLKVANSNGMIIRDTKTVQTTDATVTVIDSFTMEDNSSYYVEAVVNGILTDGSQRGTFKIAATVYRDGGVATLQGSVTSLHSQASSAMTATLTVSSNDVQVSVTGVGASTYDWVCVMMHTSNYNTP